MELGKREVELLNYHAVRCPHCKKEIYIPQFRQQPGDVEDVRAHAEELKKLFNLEAEAK